MVGAHWLGYYARSCPGMAAKPASPVCSEQEGFLFLSIRVMTKVWENSPQKGTALLLLLAISDFANDDGEAWPSVPTLAKKIRMSERYTQMLLGELVTEKELQVKEQASKYGTNIYRVIGVKPASPVKRSAPKGEAEFTEGVKPASHNPSLNHQEPLQAPKPTVPDNDPVKILAQVFEQATGVCLQNMQAGRQGPTFWAPLKRMVKMADGRAPDVMRRTVAKMRADRLNISSPLSVEKVFTSLNGEQQARPSYVSRTPEL